MGSRKKPKTIKVWVSKYIAPPSAAGVVEGVIRCRRQPFHWYVPATLTLTPPPKPKKEGR